MEQKKERMIPMKDRDLESCIHLLKREGKAFHQYALMTQRLKQLERETDDSRVRVYRSFLNVLKHGYSGSAEQKYRSGMKALCYAKQENEEHVMRESYRVLANLASASGDWNLAIDYCWKALEGITELTHESAEYFQEVNFDLAIIFDRIGDIKNVARYTKKALKYLDKYKGKDDSARRLLAYYNLAYAYQCMMSHDLFEHYLNECKKILEEHPEITRLRYAVLVESCILAIQKGRKEEADAYLKEVLKFEFKGQFWDVLFTLFELLLERGEFEPCKIILDYLKPLVEKRNELMLDLFFLENEIAYYRTVGDRKQYGESCRRYYDLIMKEREENRKATLKSLDVTIRVNKKELLLKGAKQEQILLAKKLEQDELTGLSSRYRIKECGNAMIEKAWKENKEITVELMDVDYFKQYNDTYGHLEGDACLKRIGNVIKSTLRKEDVGIRFGGDEFLIIRRNCNKNTAEKLAEDIKKKVSALAISHIDSPIGGYVTVSQGIVSSVPMEGQNLKYFLHLADQMLYKVKESGRNGIHLYQDRN